MAKYCFSAERILNIDESGISTVLPPPKIIAQTGYKQAGQSVSREQGEQVTFVGIVSASGTAFPPVYIFPRQQYKDAFLDGAPDSNLGLAIASGWMTKEGFLDVIKHVQKFIGSSKENTVLVLSLIHI